ncbi:hypothetical protein N7465_000961 [Penicillium sp. CMV-2018d]|nr:hypothetical protein N7465_000961 [Penicillium sp. CMV-2018d]
MAASRVTKSWHRKGAPEHYTRESILNSKENREDKEQSVWLSNCNKSSTGIGRAAATLLASKGAKIVLADVDETKAKEAVKELRLARYEAGFCHDSAIHKMSDEKWDMIMKIHNYAPFSNDPRLIRALDGSSDCRYAQDCHQCVFDVWTARPNWSD